MLSIQPYRANFTGCKCLEALHSAIISSPPVLTKDFSSIERLLKKYDANQDGALDPLELKAFAEDLRP